MFVFFRNNYTTAAICYLTVVLGFLLDRDGRLSRRVNFSSLARGWAQLIDSFECRLTLIRVP